MKRHVIPVRDDWKKHAEDHGFLFHTMYGQPYWNEGVYYTFSTEEIENKIEDPTTELHNMCLEAVQLCMRDEELLLKMGIPKAYHDYLYDSWMNHRDDSLYGRFDFIYDGEMNPIAKLLEYNADTPTSLWEASIYQWAWMVDARDQDLLPRTADQYNSIHEALLEAMMKFKSKDPMYFCSSAGNQEDYATVEYLGYVAKEAGIVPLHIDLQAISINNRDQFCSKEGDLLKTIFVLYPWEDMFRDDFGQYLPRNKETRWVEPAWKSLLSNKGLLPLLWQMYPNHPNLLPAYFLKDGFYPHQLPNGTVTKPLFSREGASIVMRDGTGHVIEESEDVSYNDNEMIVQAYVEMKAFDGNFPIIGSWVVDGKACGMGIREDNSRITQDLSRFTPHVIRD